MRHPAFLRDVLLACACMAAGLLHAQSLPSLRVGIGLTKPPYIMESGHEGIEYEIAEQALAAAGYKMEPVQLPPVRGLAMFRANQLDGLLTVDPGIGGSGFFSEPYIVYQNVATSLASRKLNIQHIDDLLEYSVAAFQNANTILGEEFRSMAARHRNYKEYSAQITQDKLLFTGRVDVVVGDRMIFQYFSKHLEMAIPANQPVSFHRIFPPNPRHVVFQDRRVRDKFNDGLQTIRSNGVYDAILKKYKEYM